MATITGRITIVAVDEAEFNSLVAAATNETGYTIASTDEPNLTLVVDLNGA